MNLKVIVILFFILYAFRVSAQTSPGDTTKFTPRTLTAEEFVNFQLPPLETLYENAKKNPRIQAIGAAIESAKYDKKLKKRDWFNYFSVRAGYNYGILGIYTDSETKYDPLMTTYTGSTQSSWSVGANVSIPLDHLINHRLTVKKTQLAIETAEYSQEITLNEIKGEIIELHSNVQYFLNMLENASQSISLYEANYNIAKSEFINNRISTGELSQLDTSRKKALEEYRTIINQLKITILKLEIISNTKLINK